MKQSLQLRLGQQLTMTPQLQQAIKLLQLSTLDLQQEIQQVLDSNMMLELDEEESKSSQAEENEASVPKDNTDQVTSEGSQTDIPDELPIDTSWEDIYQSLPMPTATADFPDYDQQRSKAETLHEHLQWQLELSPFSERDHAIAEAIIDAVDEDGYLTNSIDDIYQGLLTQVEGLEKDEVVAVLHQVQNFEPVGVAAADLGDCLKLQLLQLPESEERRLALELVTQHLALLAAQDKAKLLKSLAVSDRQLEKVIELIRSLDPRPGSSLQNKDSEYVVPDVFVRKIAGIWQVSLNADVTPRLRINPFYSGMIKRADNSKDNACMREHLQEARWFIKSLHSRNDTLLRVARCIVAKQTDFLEYGQMAMKPMVLRDVAEELELHESTISRVTTQKYMHTPNGIVEFKFFFSSHVSTESGGECSSIAIRAFIKDLIEHENPVKPLSDSKISDLLKEKGINVARRTIAKYREAMSIPPSNQRKRLL